MSECTVSRWGALPSPEDVEREGIERNATSPVKDATRNFPARAAALWMLIEILVGRRRSAAIRGSIEARHQLSARRRVRNSLPAFRGTFTDVPGVDPPRQSGWAPTL